MAFGATVFKVELQIADMDRSHYQTHALVVARHPSETDERLMVRILAFALNASETLAFGKGLSAEDEADLYDRDLTGRVSCWIDVGLPSDRDIRKACGRADEVKVYVYGGRSVAVWWKQNQDVLERCRNLSIVEVPLDASRALAALAQRTMRLQCTVQDGVIWVGDDKTSVEIEPVFLRARNG